MADRFVITIVGLGLMGGSMAMALRGFRDAHIIGVEIDENSLRDALDSQTIDEGYILSRFTAEKAFSRSDVVMLCVFAHDAIAIAEQYAKSFKAGCLVTDITGVKGAVIQSLGTLLPDKIEFIGGHPMAGREISGFNAAIPTLFNGCNYVIIPTDRSSQSSVELIRELALYIGSGRITLTDAATHDRMIAYTSQMAHIIAAATVNSTSIFNSIGYEGNSFRDITRVATLNPAMWSELFMLNKDALCGILSELEGNIAMFRTKIESGDQKGLYDALQASVNRKEEWQNAKSRNDHNLRNGQGI